MCSELARRASRTLGGVMNRLEKLGADILLAQVICGSVVFFGTPQPGADTLALSTAMVVALVFAVIAMLRGEEVVTAVSISSASALFASLFHLNSGHVLSGIFFGFFVLISFATAALAAALVKRDEKTSMEETFIQVFFIALPAMGGLKYLNAWMWRRWLRGGPAK